MKHTLHQLAYRNLKKYKKHYMIVSFIVLLTSIFFMTYVMTWENHYDVEKIYNQKTYGDWYVWLDVEDAFFMEIEDVLNHQDVHPTYGYYYDQGYDDEGNNIGFIDNFLYEMCHLQLKEGHYPQNDDEIMVSRSFAKSKGYQINQEVELSVAKLELMNYKIVGIIENSQDIFPSIYTNLKTGDLQLIADGAIGEKEWDKYVLFESAEDYYNGIGYCFGIIHENEFGYDVNLQNSHVQFSSEQMIILTEVFLLIAFVMSLLTSSSLKKRNQEFSLLRGIGMTTKQLFTMVFYEVLWTNFISVLIGFIVSIALSYSLMLYFEIIYHEFLFQIDLFKTIGLLLLLLGLMLVSALYPIYSSTKQVLSGAFGGRSFQYIQVRYRELKYQTKWRLAFRELMVTKKITFSILFLICLLIIPHSLSYISKSVISHEINEVNNDILHTVDVYDVQFNEKDILEISSLYSQDFQVYRLGYFEEDGNFNGESFNNVDISAIDDFDVLSHCIIEGRIPENNHEVLISKNASLYKTTQIDETNIESLPVGNLKVGDQFMLNHQEYEVVGYVSPNEIINVVNTTVHLSYMPTASIVMMGEEFDKNCQDYRQILMFYTESLDESRELATKLKNDQKFKEARVQMSDEIFLESYYFNDSQQFIKVQISFLMYIFPILTCLVVSYFINKNYIMNNYSDYAIYRLIGMSQKDLILKQFCKAIIMTIFIFFIELIWTIMVSGNYGVIAFPYLYLILSSICVFFFYVIIYCLPLYTLLKEDFMNSLTGNE